MRSKLIFLLLFTTSFLFSQINSKDLQDIRVDVVYLASDLLKGREAGTESEKMAAQYISSRFEDLGLIAKGTEGFFQPFDFKFKPNPHESTTEERNGRNVIAFLDNKAESTVIIGAHFDHLGFGSFGSRSVGEPEIHNGADDNASGVASMLKLAEWLKNSDLKNNNYLFIGFSAEELGLFGSKHFVENPTIPLKSVNCMINMDMIGRLNPAKVLAVNGFGTSLSWKEIFDKVNVNNITVKTTNSGIGPSDHTSFYLKDLPVLHYFSGQHTDYHKPEDDSEDVNYEGIYEISQHIFEVIKHLDESKKLEFTKTKDSNEGRTVSKFKVTLGVMPDYVYEGTGMRIDGVLGDRPAEKAGILKGDVIIQIGDLKVENIYDYMDGLANFKEGDKTIVTVKRADKEITLKIKF